MNSGWLYVLGKSLLLLRLKLEFPGCFCKFRFMVWKIACVVLGKDGSNNNKYSTSITCWNKTISEVPSNPNNSMFAILISLKLHQTDWLS